MHKRTTLENGIRVLTESIPGVGSVSMGVIVDCGSRHDPQGKGGLAHLCEHLFFQGTSSRDALQIKRFIDEAGGHVGGMATRDYTNFYATVIDDYCPFAIELLGDILLNSIFPEESLRREKESIAQENSTLLDDPEHYVQERLKEMIFKGHPLSRPIGGDVESVSGLTREDVIYFIHQYYLCERMIITAAGNLNHEDFVAQVRDGFWRMLNDRSNILEGPPRFQGGISIEHSSVRQVYFSLGLNAPRYTHEDRYFQHLMNRILGGGISSRLFRKIRDEQGLVYHIGSEYHPYRDAGVWVVEGCTTPENLMAVLSLTLIELGRLLSGDMLVSEEELLLAKRQLRSEHLISGESTHTRMGRLATQEFYFGRSISSAEVIESISSIDLNQFNEFLQRSMGPCFSEIALSMVGPEQKKCYSVELVKELFVELWPGFGEGG